MTPVFAEKKKALSVFCGWQSLEPLPPDFNVDEKPATGGFTKKGFYFAPSESLPQTRSINIEIWGEGAH